VVAEGDVAVADVGEPPGVEASALLGVCVPLGG
jgi:hypothetical protein